MTVSPSPLPSFGELPRPDRDACEHSAELVRRIRRCMDDCGGHISFRRYMNMALNEPGLGYYSAGAVKFGPAGDFITAPEISPLFSYCIARQCRQVLALVGGETILELGAGSGSMACHVLKGLARFGSVPERYLILETSADLRQRQCKLLRHAVPEHFSRITWLDALPDEPFRGVIIANEVLDALPVRRLLWLDGAVMELGVRAGANGFEWHESRRDGELRERVESLLPTADWTDGYRTEINTDMENWLGAVTGQLEAGAMLVIDYGYTRREYYHPQRRDGTLICHYRHRSHADPFFYPGLQDISASVEFTAVAEAGARAGLDLCGFTSQAHFLMGTGINDLIAAGCRDDPAQLTRLSREAKYLMLPGELGERFKVMALGRRINRSLIGFSVADHRSRL